MGRGIILTCLAACLGLLIFLGFYSQNEQEPKSMLTHMKIPTDSLESKQTTTSATIVAVGDILVHENVYQDARTENGYNFKPMFAKVKPYIQKADIAVVNQETMIGGQSLGLSGYPTFNSPFAVGDALKYAGFDVVTMANNHTLDGGVQAIKQAIHYWEKLGMTHTGSFLSADERDRIRTVESQGITFFIFSLYLRNKRHSCSRGQTLSREPY